MLKSLTHMKFIAVALLIASPLHAQEAATEGAEAPQADQPAAEEAAPEAVLDLGQEIPDGPQLGERYSKEKFGDWDLACVKTDQEQDPCSLLQLMLDSNGTPMAEMSLFRIDQENSQAVAGATIIVPLETLLNPGITLSIDGAPAKRYGFAFCNPLGCVAQVGFTQSDIDALKKGNTATLSLRPAPAPEQTIDMDLSLKGFTAGYKVVDVVKQ